MDLLEIEPNSESRSNPAELLDTIPTEKWNLCWRRLEIQNHELIAFKYTAYWTALRQAKCDNVVLIVFC